MVDFARVEDVSQLPQYWTLRNEAGLSLQDAVHGQVQLGPTARLLCDSSPVQRLRGLAQLGCTRWAFPCAEHSRFGHCVGTAHLAVAAAAHLAGTGLSVRPADVELLEAAALWHDVGHGPFSHTFENCFMPAVHGNHEWHHEKMSARLLEYAVDQQCIDIDKQQRQLMHSIISGGQDSSSSSSQLLDCSESAWLLQIVANAVSGVDVDKVDYLRRDARMTRAGQTYDFTQLFRNCKVVDGELCFHASQQGGLAGLFEARAAMHSQVYQHRAAKAAELMVVDALLAADPALGISRDAHDPEAFLTLDDSLLGEIKRSARRSPQCPHLRAAAAILRRLDCRDLYAWAAEVTVPEQFVLERGAAACSLTAADVLMQQDSSLGLALTEQDLRVDNMKIDYGKGDHDPLDYVRLYVGSSSTWPASQGITRPATLVQRKVRVFLAKQCPSSERSSHVQAVQAAFTRAAQARFGSDVRIACDDGSSAAKRQAWQQQQQQQKCGTLAQQAAVAAAGGPTMLAGQHVAQAAAGVVSWPQSPLQQQRRRRRLPAMPADEDMAGSEDGQGVVAELAGNVARRAGLHWHGQQLLS